MLYIYGLALFFTQLTRCDLVTSAAQHRSLDNILVQLNWQFYHQISDESTLLSGEYILKPNLSCEVPGGGGALSAIKSEGWSLGASLSPFCANGFGRGVLLLCTLLLVRRRWWQWSSMNFIEQRLSWVILQQPLQMYSCILKAFLDPQFIFKCVVYANLLLFFVPTASFVKFCNKGFAPIIILYNPDKLVGSL